MGWRNLVTGFTGGAARFPLTPLEYASGKVTIIIEGTLDTGGFRFEAGIDDKVTNYRTQRLTLGTSDNLQINSEDSIATISVEPSLKSVELYYASGTTPNCSVWVLS
jgi:hypothetical protein